jgi:hypothetical protein
MAKKKRGTPIENSVSKKVRYVSQPNEVRYKQSLKSAPPAVRKEMKAIYKESLQKYNRQQAEIRSGKYSYLQTPTKGREQLERIKQPFAKVYRQVAKIKFSPQGRNTLLQYANAFGGTPVRISKSGNGKSLNPVGRPRGSLKHRSPFNGQPIPALEFYKQIREFKRIQSQRANAIEEQGMAAFASQGVPPRQIPLALQRQTPLPPRTQPFQGSRPPQFQRTPPIQRPFPPRPPIPQNQVPNIQRRMLQTLPNGTVIPQGTPVWKWRRGTVGTDWGLFGRHQVIYGAPQSFFN